MIETQSKSPTQILIERREEQLIYPALLSTKRDTWKSLKAMGVNPDLARFAWIDDGTHIQPAFQKYWGWWKCVVQGWYPYTEWRDYELDDRTGAGRPWLRLLSERWNELIFRELVLLTFKWNAIVAKSEQFTYTDELPIWMGLWLSLTNDGFERGVQLIERFAYEHQKPKYPPEVLNFDVQELVKQYEKSWKTWRPMMPKHMTRHRKYGDRAEYWSFE